MSGDGPDMVNRDPNELNSLIQVAFEDVLGEPAGVRSADCVWRNAYTCFECGKNLCYKLLTILCGICIALAWGCHFAGIAFSNIWCFTPCLRCLSICIGCVQKVNWSIINCCLGPCCETGGLCLSKIVVTKK